MYFNYIHSESNSRFVETCLNKIKRPTSNVADRRKSRCNTMAVGDLKPPGPSRGDFRTRVGSSSGHGLSRPLIGRRIRQGAAAVLLVVSSSADKAAVRDRVVSGPVVSHGPGDTRLRTESGGGWSHHWITIITSLSCQAPGHAEAAPRLAGAGPRSWRRCGRWCRPSPPWTPAARSAPAPARASTGPNGLWILPTRISPIFATILSHFTIRWAARTVCSAVARAWCQPWRVR